MEGIADTRAGCNWEDRRRWCPVDRRCDWPFVDAWSVVAVAGDSSVPIVPAAAAAAAVVAAAACLDTQDGSWERRKVGDTMMMWLPIWMEKWPNAGPSSLHACHLLTTGPP